MKTYVQFYKALALLLYGAESWTLTRQQKTSIEVAEMRFLGAVLGYKQQDKKRNEDIRQELSLSSLVSEINKYQKKWYVRLGIMKEIRIPRITLNYRPYGRRSRGRPPLRWRLQFSLESGHSEGSNS
jgi:hypothetical protein